MSDDWILSSRLTIRAFTGEDVTDEYIGWLNDRELMKYSRQRFLVHDRYTCNVYLERFRDSPNFFWNIVRRTDGLQVGTATAYVDPINFVVDVGLLIGYPGEGYGSEAFGAIVTYLFAEYEARKVTCGTLSLNQAMCQIASRWGLRLEGTLRASEPMGDKYWPVNLYGILKCEWERR